MAHLIPEMFQIISISHYVLDDGVFAKSFIPNRPSFSMNTLEQLVIMNFVSDSAFHFLAVKSVSKCRYIPFYVITNREIE